MLGLRHLMAALVLAMAPLAACAADGSADAPIVLDEARFLFADDAQPPADDRPWVPVRLPDNWSDSRMDAQGVAWYRTSFELPAVPSEPQAVLIRRLSMNGEIFLNGSRLFSGGRMQPPVTHNWNTPFFVELPAALLRPGRNVLDVRLYAYRNNNGGLGPVHVGPAAVLQPQFLGVEALHVKGSIVSFAVALVAAFIGFVAWMRMGRDPLYGLFGLAMLCWTVRYANYFVQEVPIGHVAYATAANSAQGWFFVFFTPFLLRLTGLHRHWAERGLLAVGLIGTVSIWSAFRGLLSLKVVVAVWALVWVPGAAALLALSARHAWQQRSARGYLAALIVWLYVPLTLRELLITSNVMPFDASYVAHYVGIPLALLISWMLVDRVVESSRQAVRAELARAQAAFDERQRLTQDMHDGLGLQLNAALRVAERGAFDRDRFGEMLRACLDELRLIVDSSAADGGTLLPLLASLRMRLQPRLQAAGLRVDWSMGDFPPDLRLAPDASLQVLRIVQEALNNAIKHANASAIAVGAARSTAGIALTVRDDGTGFDPGAASVGKGLGGMKRRAAKAGVGLHINSSGGGTCITIELPCVAPATPGEPQAAGLP